MGDNNDSELTGYPLQRHFFSSIRLYLQYWMWRRELGYLLHPSVIVNEGTLVADIACGNCAWLVDLARSHPGAHIHGFDISSAQFPHQHWLPKNTELSTLDILEPVPDKLLGKYDIVHVGLLVVVVQHDDPIPILENLLALLKPGGYLQWDEADLGGICIDSPNADISCVALEQLRDEARVLFENTKGTSFSWVRGLGAIFEKHDLTVLDDKFLPINDDISHPWSLTHLMASVEIINVIDRPQGNAEARKWWEIYERAAAEVRQGATIRMAMVSVVGRR